MAEGANSVQRTTLDFVGATIGSLLCTRAAVWLSRCALGARGREAGPLGPRRGGPWFSAHLESVDARRGFRAAASA